MPPVIGQPGTETRVQGLLPLLLAGLAATAGCGRVAEAPVPADPPAATVRPGFDPAELDPSVRPQDDFWAWVNGRWLARTTIPPHLASYGSYEALTELTEARLRVLLEQPVADGPAGDRRPMDLYRSFLASAGPGKPDLGPLAAELHAIGRLRTHDDVIAWFGVALAAGIQTPLAWYADADAFEPSRALPYFWQDGLGLPDRDYYLSDAPELVAVRSAYGAHITRLHELAGWPAGGAAATILDLERQLAERHWSALQNRDMERIYRSRYSLAELRAMDPGFDWILFLERAGFGRPAELVLAQADYFTALGTLVREIPVADWRTWLRFKVLKHYAPFLGEILAAEDFAFEGGVLRGQESLPSTWQRGVRLVSGELGELLGQLYVAEHFPPGSRARVGAMVDHLRQAFAASLGSADWMDPATRSAALTKLANLRSKVGYPDRWRVYAGVVISPDDLIGNLRQTRRHAHRHEVDKLSRPVERDEWAMTPQTVNAYYRPTYNEVVFPAAILQPPFFDPAADDAYNYGATGATIGHELSHGFDDQGRKFDGEGRLRDWWSPADAARYGERTARLAAWFSQFSPLPDLPIDGELTLGETIADLAGLVLAYRAWRLSLDGREPPVIAGFTGDQRFFIGYAISFRGQYRPERLREALLSEPHPPDEYRVRGILPHVPEFHAAFGVGPGDGHYLAPADRIALW